jgi:hypothetical protein
MKKWMLIVGWFALLLAWNFATKTSMGGDHSLIERGFLSIEYLLSPYEIIVSIIALVLIWKIRSKGVPVEKQ